MYALECKSLPNTQYYHTMKEAIRMAELLGLKRYKVRPVH